MANRVDVFHDFVKPRIYLLACPGNAHAVLRHLQPGGSHTARVCRFAGAIKDSRLEKTMHSLHRRRHVRAFRNDIDAILEQVVRVFLVNFILGCAGKGALCFDIPKRIVIELRIDRREHCALEFVGVFRNAAPPDIF